MRTIPILIGGALGSVSRRINGRLINAFTVLGQTKLFECEKGRHCSLVFMHVCVL